METACEASLTWHRQTRFQRVCPLLKHSASGDLRCSVDTSDVRPFWSRALFIYGGALLAAYLAVTLGYFALQRVIGVPVGYVTIVYPPHWPRLDLARSQYFIQRADRALVAGQIGDAEKSLTVAYSLHPANYAAGLKLALLYQHSQPTLSDGIYARLLHEHPLLRAGTATSWYQALLIRGDIATIVPLTITALTVDSAHEAAWTNALLFALRHAPIEKLEKLVASPELPAGPREILALEISARREQPNNARQALLSVSVRSPYFDYYRLSRLISLGFASDARTLLRSTPGLSVRDYAALSLESMAALGWQSVLDGEIDRLLVSAPGPAVCEILAVHLIRHPDRERLARLLANVSTHPLPANDAGHSASMAILAAAGVNKDAALFKESASIVEKIAGGRFRARASIEAFFLQPARGARIETILPALQPLSAELNYALLERFVPVPPSGAIRTNPPAVRTHVNQPTTAPSR
jgi:hypothetical protein